MKILPALFVVCIFFSPLLPQDKTDHTRFGVQFNPFISSNEFPYESGIKTSWLARALVRFGINSYITGEAGAGAGQYTGYDNYQDYYKTMIYPADIRILFKFSQTPTFVYFFAGVGGMYYKTDNPPGIESPQEVKESGFTFLAPGGLGLQIALSPNVDMDINIGAAITGTDNLNSYKDGEAPDAYYFTGVGFLFGHGISDSDGDGLMSDQEESLGTNPEDADTDKDGLRDGDEILAYTTDPLNRDTDGDGLTDGDEVNRYKTNPNKPDSDNDGLNDREEIIDYKTDPLSDDSDGDTLIDGDEVRKYRSNPLDSDTDNDTLMDNDELTIHKTNPLKPDSDDDGLTDAEEISKYRTNPGQKDTDNGSVADGTEIRRGTDPLDPDDDVIKIGRTVILEGIVFESNSAEISVESAEVLNLALQTLRDNQDIRVEISGHTDDVGSTAANRRLSLARANSVKQWLVDNGIEESRMQTAGYGEDRPVVPNDTPDNRRKNRRIEFLRIK